MSDAACFAFNQICPDAKVTICMQSPVKHGVCKLSSFRGDGQWLGVSKLADSDTFVGLCSSGSLFVACLS